MPNKPKQILINLTNHTIMKNSIIFTFILALSFVSCKNNEHGCLDYTATNYNEEASVDNNSCCYTCYTSEDTLGVYCGSELDKIIRDGFPYVDWYQFAMNPQFDSDGTPIYPYVQYD